MIVCITGLPLFMEGWGEERRYGGWYAAAFYELQLYNRDLQNSDPPPFHGQHNVLRRLDTFWPDQKLKYDFRKYLRIAHTNNALGRVLDDEEDQEPEETYIIMLQ